MTQQIFIVDVQHAASARRVADSTEIFWSPDSRSLTYTLYRFGDYDVYSMNLETQVEQTLTDTLEDERYPVWSPDGLRLAYVATYGFADFLRILYPDGTVHNIDLSAMIGRRVFVGEPPIWSPDGTQIVLSLITPSIPNAYSLYLVTLGNGIVNVRRLSEGGHSELHPAWRP
jgi:Tol biopolymer transport system component